MNDERARPPKKRGLRRWFGRRQDEAAGKDEPAGEPAGPGEEPAPEPEPQSAPGPEPGPPPPAAAPEPAPGEDVPAAVPEQGDGPEPDPGENRPGLLRRLFGTKPGEPDAEPAGVGEAEDASEQRPAVPDDPGAVPDERPAGPGDAPEPKPEPMPAAPTADEPEAPGDEAGPGPAGDGEEAGAPVEPGDEPEADGRGLLSRLRRGLSKTRQGFVQKVDRVLFGKKEIDADTLDELEEALVTADLGVNTAVRLVDDIRERVSRKELASPDALRDHLKDAILEILSTDAPEPPPPAEGPRVVMVVGVNGVGKTTTIGKLAALHVREGRKVVLAAGDTFRAAAIEQLQIWGERTGAHVVRHQDGSDPAAVAFDAGQAARARAADVVIVDTAGRLHTKKNLMEELKKVHRVIGKALPGAPHQVLLVLDATTGQNAVSQARLFHEAVGVDAIALTKLDGTAKGGVIVAVAQEVGAPIRYIGIGEQVDDLRPFDPRAFVDALF